MVEQRLLREFADSSTPDVPRCCCGADLVGGAELTIDRAPEPGRPPVSSVPVPASECGECGRNVGAMYGMRVVVALWQSRGADPDDPVNAVNGGGQ